MAEQDYVRLAAACHCGQPAKLWSGIGRKPKFCGEHGSDVAKQPRTKLCIGCGAEVTARGNQRYCVACSAKRLDIRTYAGCSHEKPVFANGKQRKFCFDCVPKPKPKPRKQRKSADYRLSELTICASPQCVNQFTRRLPHERFCSDACRNHVSNRAGQERRRNSEPRACRHCGKVYVPEYGSLRTHYCTLECRRKAINLATGGNTHRRRAKKFGCEYTPVNRRDVFERDGWKCYLCGRDTPADLSGARAPNSPEIDHVVPMSKLGPHSYSNTRCCCRACNLAKSNKLAGT